MLVVLFVGQLRKKWVMELIELERTTDAIDWEDLTPQCDYSLSPSVHCSNPGEFAAVTKHFYTPCPDEGRVWWICNACYRRESTNPTCKCKFCHQPATIYRI